MQLSTPDLVVFLKKFNPSILVEGTIIVVFGFLLTATILSGIRASLDDSAWPVVVCVFNVVALTVLLSDAWFFSFKSFWSLVLLLLFDSITTVGNIVMCFVGEFYMRAISSLILIFWFSSKGILIAITMSTTMNILSKLMETEGIGEPDDISDV